MLAPPDVTSVGPLELDDAAAACILLIFFTPTLTATFGLAATLALTATFGLTATLPLTATLTFGLALILSFNLPFPLALALPLVLILSFNLSFCFLPIPFNLANLAKALADGKLVLRNLALLKDLPQIASAL